MKKKIFDIIKDSIESLIFLLRLHLEIIRDFLFLVLLLIDINTKSYFKLYKIRLLINFLGQNKKYGWQEWKKNVFARYFIINDIRFKVYYSSLKCKNSLIFQVFSFLYSFIIEYYLRYFLFNLIPYNYYEIVNEFLEKLSNKVLRAIGDNYYYLYLLEFQNYKNKYSKSNYRKYSVIIFFLETYLNISYYFNGRIYNSKFLRKIEDKFELKIESYF